MHTVARREFVYWIGIVAAFGFLVGTWVAEDRLDLSATGRGGIALGQVGLWGLIVYLFVQISRRQDEMAKRIQFEALAWAFPISLFGIVATGILIRALEVTTFDLGDATWVLAAAYLIGILITTRKYS